MTVMAAEAGAGAVEASAAETGAASRQAFTGRRGTRAPATRPKPQRSSERRIAETGPLLADHPQRGSRGQRRQRRPPARSSGSGGTNYQNVVLVEFVLAILLVAATPFARKNKPGLSPYAGQDLLQLVAITVLYFLLALMAGSSGKTARLSAWFGGLILLTVGLGEAAALAKALDVFGIASKKTQAQDEAGPSGTTQAPGTTTAGGRG